MNGLPCIGDTRVTVSAVLGQLAAGRMFDEVLADYPYLVREDLLAALEFAAATLQERELVDRGPSPGAGLTGTVGGVSLAQLDPLPATRGRSPRAIRTALLPEEAGGFDREYRQAMREATETLDLTPVLEMLERWHRVALLSRDPERHRRMLDHAERLQRGEDLPMIVRGGPSC